MVHRIIKLTTVAVIAVTLLAGCTKANPMTAISDNFTNVDGTDITAHSAGGVTWAKFKAPAIATIQSNKVQFGEDGGTQAGGIMSGRVFSTHDQWAQCSYDTSTGIAGPLVRGSITGDPEAGGGSGDAYILRIYNTNWQVCRMNGTGSLTILDSGSGIATTGTAKLEADGTTITATINGVEVSSITNSAVTQGKRAGINWSTGTPVVDDFSAQDTNVTTATSYEFDGPEIGEVSVESTDFTLNPVGGDWPASQSINLASDGSGTFYDSEGDPVTSIDVGGLSGPVTFTYTPSSKVGSPHALSVAADPALGTDPDAIDYTVVDYTTITTTSPNGQDITILVPSAYDADTGAHVVLYSHGNNGSDEEAANRTVPEQAAFIDGLIDAGYIVAASHMHGNNWGNDDALADLVDLYSYCVTNYRLRDTLLWSGSMGGLPGLLAIADDRIPRVKGWLGIVPVCNLGTMFGANDQTYSATIRTAYGIAGDGSDYATKTAGHDPVLLDAETFAGIGMMFISSPSDTAVPEEDNSDAMFSLVDGVAYESSQVHHTGDHGDPTRYAKAVSDGLPFFTRCLAIEDTGSGSGDNGNWQNRFRELMIEAGFEVSK